MTASFEWDPDKDAENRRKHGVDFGLAQQAFLDPKRVVAVILLTAELKNAFTALEESAREFLLCGSRIGMK